MHMKNKLELSKGDYMTTLDFTFCRYLLQFLLWMT